MPYSVKEFHKTCGWCKSPFAASTPAQKFCCDECHSAHMKKYRQEHYTYVKGEGIGFKKVLGKCFICGSDIHKINQRYCFDCVVDMLVSEDADNRKRGFRIMHTKGFTLKDMLKAVKDGVALW